MDFISFYECCYEVIQGCCKIHNPPQKGQKIALWLKENGYSAGVDFHGKLGGDLKYFQELFNKCKHTSSELISFNFNKSSYAVVGFYVKTAFPDGSVGPDENIHPMYRGYASASSFNYVLRKLYYLFYRMVDSLGKVIRQQYNELHGVDLKIKPDYKTDGSYWKEVYDLMSKLPDSYFPNESRKIYKAEKSGDNIIFPKKPTHIDLEGWAMYLVERGDGVTLTYKMPYAYGIEKD